MYELFEKFWTAYPRRLAKAAAFHEFKRAMTKTTLDVLLSAVESYKKHKPDYCDWAHPRTWLHQERWTDEWEPPKTIMPEPLFRPLRNLDEARAYCQQHKPDCLKYVNAARSIEDLPVFIRNVPKDWTPNVVQMRRGAA
jgi:hypothetical protein